MYLTYLMLTGSLSGLVSVLLHSILASARTSVRPGAVIPPLEISDALLHMLYGCGFALLFWLSWGLAAVVAVPWWVRITGDSAPSVVQRKKSSFVVGGFVALWYPPMSCP